MRRHTLASFCCARHWLVGATQSCNLLLLHPGINAHLLPAAKRWVAARWGRAKCIALAGCAFCQLTFCTHFFVLLNVPDRFTQSDWSQRDADAPDASLFRCWPDAPGLLRLKPGLGQRLTDDGDPHRIPLNTDRQVSVLRVWRSPSK